MIHSPAMRPNKYLALSLSYLLIAGLAIGLAVTGRAQAKDPSTVPALKRVEAKSQAVAAKALPATVGIINQSLAGGGHLGEGSGVVVSEDGIVLTAGHVLGEPGTELTVIFPDGRRAAAKALGANYTRDTGVVRITDPGKWPHVEMGHSADIKAGAWCIAAGHPGGVQVGRAPPLRLGRILAAGAHARFLVSDATVISGDSGGPLFDLEGRVIGIHSNIGFSVNQNQHVPIDAYRDQWDDLLASKTFGTPRDSQHTDIPPEKLQRFGELFFKRMMAGDPDAAALMKNGQYRLSEQEMDRWIAKWEKAEQDKADAYAASHPLDFLKFQRLFQERLLAGDQETLKLVKDGKMMLTPAQMHKLMDQWEQKSLASGNAKPKPGETANNGPAKPSAPSPSQPPRRPSAQPPVPEKAKAEDLAKMRDMMRNAEVLGDGRFRFRSSPDDEQAVRSLPGWGAAARAMSYGKSSPQMLREIAPIAAAAGRSTVVVLCDGKPAVLGTVVRKDGFILTKASELHGKITCRVDTQELPATIVKTRSEHDLVLLKVDAKDMTPIVWAEGESPVPGSWLITPSADNDAIGLGIVSIAARQIPDAPTMVLRNRAVIGVMIDQQATNALIQAVTPGMPAALGGMQAGDVIEKIDGQAMKGPKDVNQFLAKYKPGDRITVEITRSDKPLTLKLTLVSSDNIAPRSTGEHLARLSEAGGTLSKRHSRFVNAFTHDTVLQAADCGGPIVNLDGNAVGLNIARADRTATYAIPAKMLRMLMAEMLPK